MMDYISHGSQGLFTQVRFNDCTQGEPSQVHFGLVGPSQSKIELAYLAQKILC